VEVPNSIRSMIDGSSFSSSFTRVEIAASALVRPRTVSSSSDGVVSSLSQLACTYLTSAAISRYRQKAFASSLRSPRHDPL
jgi:hypothetical protein